MREKRRFARSEAVTLSLSLSVFAHFFAPFLSNNILLYIFTTFLYKKASEI